MSEPQYETVPIEESEDAPPPPSDEGNIWVRAVFYNADKEVCREVKIFLAKYMDIDTGIEFDDKQYMVCLQHDTPSLRDSLKPLVDSFHLGWKKGKRDHKNSLELNASG